MKMSDVCYTVNNACIRNSLDGSNRQSKTDALIFCFRCQPPRRNRRYATAVNRLTKDVAYCVQS